jgi:GT2 family glycosyltransferase
MTASAPAVTVLMPAYNAAAHLKEALESIFRQTFSDFELVVVEDGSTDDTPTILRACGDSRLSVLANERNLGVISSLNRGLEAATGEFVARMDADDVALPKRLERQVNFLRNSPQIGLCGTWFETFGGAHSAVVRPPTDPDDMAATLFYESPLGHPTVMFRRKLFEEHGLRYSHDCLHAEDFDLWTKVARVTKLANIPEVHLRYRWHDKQITNLSKARQRESVRSILLRQLRVLRPGVSEAECEMHVALMTNQFSRAPAPDPEQVESWLLGLIGSNDQSKEGFPSRAFWRAIAAVWWRFCSSRAAQPGILRAFYLSKLTRWLPLKYKLAMLAVRIGYFTERG